MKYILTSLAMIGTITLTPSYTAELTCTQIIKDTENIKKVLAIEAYEATGNSLRYMKRIEDIQATITRVARTKQRLLYKPRKQRNQILKFIKLKRFFITYKNIRSI